MASFEGASPFANQAGLEEGKIESHPCSTDSIATMFTHVRLQQVVQPASQHGSWIASIMLICQTRGIPRRKGGFQADGIGSNASVSQCTVYRRDEIPHCCLIYFNNIGEELCASGPTSTPDDAPFGFTWYGAVLSFQDFTKNVARSPYDVRLQTFGHGQVDIHGNDVETVSNDLAAVLRDDMEYAANVVEEAERREARPMITAGRGMIVTGTTGRGGTVGPDGRAGDGADPS